MMTNILIKVILLSALKGFWGFGDGQEMRPRDHWQGQQATLAWHVFEQETFELGCDVALLRLHHGR